MTTKKAEALTLREHGNPIEAKKPECGAKLRNKDATCRSTQLMLNGRCRLHGGKTPSGIASPHHKHGRFSRVMPRPLADRFEENKADRDLVSNREQLALVNTLLEQRLKEIYEGCPPQAWKLASKLAREYEEARGAFVSANQEAGTAEPPRDPEEIFLQLKSLLAQGIKTSEAFELTEKMLEAHRKAVDTEYKLLKENQNRMDVSEVRVIAARLVDSVKRHVKDPEILRLIQGDLRRVVSPRS
jgi:hypothetical protein